MQVNPNEAPEGYIAVECRDCNKCAFSKKPLCPTTPCCSSKRIDNTFVIFIKKE